MISDADLQACLIDNEGQRPSSELDAQSIALNVCTQLAP